MIAYGEAFWQLLRGLLNRRPGTLRLGRRRRARHRAWHGAPRDPNAPRAGQRHADQGAAGGAPSLRPGLPTPVEAGLKARPDDEAITSNTDVILSILDVISS
jgi:hypothetical protein